MKIIKKIAATAATLTLFFPIGIIAVTNPPAIPLLVYGDVTIYGTPSPVGTVVSVEKNNSEIASTILTIAGKYFIQIPASNAGATLVYKVGGKVFTEKVCADPMVTGSDRIDLIIAAAPVYPSNGGGGGGSYTPLSTTTPATTTSTNTLTPEQQKVDANKDNKIDVLDFNSLMINWGKTGTGNIADFNSDGKVDIFDFNMLMINWGK
jgi:hypothetical protein